MKSLYDNSNNVLTFEELLINNKDLCSVEPDEDQIRVVKPELKKRVYHLTLKKYKISAI
jgi:hypothetical protein